MNMQRVPSCGYALQDVFIHPFRKPGAVAGNRVPFFVEPVVSSRVPMYIGRVAPPGICTMAETTIDGMTIPFNTGRSSSQISSTVTMTCRAA